MVNNIQQVSDALLCSNCGACVVVCPNNAISMSTTPLGRMFATVNNNCINCGVCTKVCPSLDKQSLHETFADRYLGTIRKVYVGKSTNKDIYENSQSGGVCTSIISYLFDTASIDAAILCQMDYGNPPRVKSVLVESKEELTNCQRSCYTPVDLLSTLKVATDKQSIAVVGLPCHIQGAESLIRLCKRFHNIRYKIGLICDRTLCAGIQNAMLGFTPPYRLSEGVKIRWRDKKPRLVGKTRYTYRNAPVVITGKGGAEQVIPNGYRFALKDYFTPPRCRVCYDKLNTFSDIVLGDPWGMSDIDWVNGASVIVTRTNDGTHLIEKMVTSGYLSLEEREVREVIKGQHIDERRTQVGRYSQALQVIPHKMDSYLYQQDARQEKEICKERKELVDFLRRDNLPQKEMVAETQHLVKRYLFRERIYRTLLIRVLRKIKKLIKS